MTTPKLSLTYSIHSRLFIINLVYFIYQKIIIYILVILNFTSFRGMFKNPLGDILTGVSVDLLN